MDQCERPMTAAGTTANYRKEEQEQEQEEQKQRRQKYAPSLFRGQLLLQLGLGVLRDHEASASGTQLSAEGG